VMQWHLAGNRLHVLNCWICAFLSCRAHCVAWLCLWLFESVVVCTYMSHLHKTIKYLSS
jgi:hypothetical protein